MNFGAIDFNLGFCHFIAENHNKTRIVLVPVLVRFSLSLSLSTFQTSQFE